jgi:hypothetical protein
MIVVVIVVVAVVIVIVAMVFTLVVVVMTVVVTLIVVIMTVVVAVRQYGRGASDAGERYDGEHSKVANKGNKTYQHQGANSQSTPRLNEFFGDTTGILSHLQLSVMSTRGTTGRRTW